MNEHNLKYIAKIKIDGTQIAVNIPAIKLPVNHKYAETTKEIATAKSMNISEVLNII